MRTAEQLPPKSQIPAQPMRYVLLSSLLCVSVVQAAPIAPSGNRSVIVLVHGATRLLVDCAELQRSDFLDLLT